MSVCSLSARWRVRNAFVLRVLVPLHALSGLLCIGASAQTYTNNTTDIPQDAVGNSSWSENVDFGDVDNDADWDAVFADGGDNGNDQNRIWINQGGAQGGTLGVFIDRTSTQFPAILDESRDIDLVDFDNDGDLDIHVSNTSATMNQSNRFWVNQGGLQGGRLASSWTPPCRVGSVLAGQVPR